MSPRGDHAGIVDEELNKLGTARRVTMAVPQFIPALAIVATTDLIATLPSRLVASQSERYQLLSFLPPVEIRPFTVTAMHHERNSNSPMHQWAIRALSETDLMPVSYEASNTAVILHQRRVEELIAGQ